MISFILGLLVGMLVVITFVVLWLDRYIKDAENRIEDAEDKLERFGELYTTVCSRLGERNAEIMKLKDQLVATHETIKRLEYERDALLDRDVIDKE